MKTGRHYVGIEINSEYCDMALQRLRQVPESLF